MGLCRECAAFSNTLVQRSSTSVTASDLLTEDLTLYSLQLLHSRVAHCCRISWHRVRAWRLLGRMWRQEMLIKFLYQSWCFAYGHSISAIRSLTPLALCLSLSLTVSLWPYTCYLLPHCFPFYSWTDFLLKSNRRFFKSKRELHIL